MYGYSDTEYLKRIAKALEEISNSLKGIAQKLGIEPKEVST